MPFFFIPKKMLYFDGYFVKIIDTHVDIPRGESTVSNQTVTMHSGRRQRTLLIILLAAALSLVIFLALTTVYSADDYWYSTFMDHGAAAYFRMMMEHYLIFNGRMLVHFVVQLILHFGNVLFALFLAGCCVMIPAAMYAMGKGEDRSVDGLLLCVLLFLSGVLMLPRSIAVNGLLWISASCNYVLPTAMVVGQVLLLRRFSGREERRFRPADLLLLGYCFLCGATTEQMGIVAVVVAGLFVLKNLVLKKTRIWVCLLAAACACCGVLTIFLSPATQQRMMQETVGDMTVGSGFVQHMKNQINLQVLTFSPSPFIIAVFGALFLFTGLLLLRRKELPKWAGAVWLALSAAGLVLFCAADGKLLLLAYLAVIGLTALQAVIWLGCGYEGMAFVLLAGLGSAGVILFTTSGGGRTLLPFCLCLLAVLAPALMSLLEELPAATARGGAVLALSLLSFIVIGVQLPGYWYNYQIDRINQDAASRAKETGELYYLMAYDKSYTHSKPYDDGYFYTKWVESTGVDPAVCRVYFYREDLPNVYVAGERAESPAQPGSGGSWLLPLRYIIESFGGSLELQGNADRILIRLGGREYTYATQGSGVTVQWQEGGADHSAEGERSQYYYATCISENLLTEVFGLQITRRDDGIYVDMP